MPPKKKTENPEAGSEQKSDAKKRETPEDVAKKLDWVKRLPERADDFVDVTTTDVSALLKIITDSEADIEAAKKEIDDKIAAAKDRRKGALSLLRQKVSTAEKSARLQYGDAVVDQAIADAIVGDPQ